MQIWLRITLLSVCTAIGIAVALAVALQTPAKQPSASPKPSDLAPTQLGQPPLASQPLPSPVIAAYRDPIARQVSQLEQSLEDIQQSADRRQRSMMRAIAAIQDRIEIPPLTAVAAMQPQPDPLPPPQANDAATEQVPLPAEPEAHSDVRREQTDEGLSISIQNTDLRAVLETISRETGLNIIASKNVTGAVTANLNGVDIETALTAILKSTGYVAAREGNIIFVGLPTDIALMNQSQDRISTRIYRPNYVKAADLQVLFTPLLSTDGKITVSAASQIDIPADQAKTGGNGFAGAEAVIVRDYETTLAQLDEIYAEVDVKPSQVAIEAMILSVKLNDTFKFGVNLGALRDQANARLISGSPPTGVGSIDISDGGLHFGFLDASLGLFIDCLEKVGDTNVIASPRLMCLNKQRAEIQIGEELGYVSTTVTESSSTQTINFLSVGTLLRIRPYIGSDGLIRLEVHPELSTGSVDVQQGLSLPQKAVTQVTTNVMCPDGCTVVIGGLIREDLTTSRSQLPFLGSVPYVGWLFRQTTQGVDRNEIIVLITPRIVSEPFMAQEGAKYGNDFTQRQAVYFDKMSPIGKRNLGQHHLRLARAAYNAGDQLAAMKQINLAIHYDPQSREAVVLRSDIVAAGGFENESIHEYLHRGLGPLSHGHRDYSKHGAPWKDPDAFGPPQPTSIPDPGTAGAVRTIVRPSPEPHNPLDPNGPPTFPTAPPATTTPEPIPTSPQQP